MSWLNQPYQQQQQTGYQQPQRTGFQPQQNQFQGQQQYTLQSQPTGYNPAMLQRPMATGYPSQQPQFQQQQPQYSGGGYPQQQQSFGGPPPVPSFPLGGGVGSQFVSTFMPSQSMNPTPYMDPAQMQFAQPSFQQPVQPALGQPTPAIPWALTPDEKKEYDRIFRAWDQQGTGFIDGKVAQEVFGQAGLERADLMAIWNLADVNDRGKLNIDEFHVAMGLIYRRLNNIPVPATLPAELAPPSARDLSDSVGFLKSLLKNDNNPRSTNVSDDFSSVGGQGSYAKSRSLHDTAPSATRKDATVYRHNDDIAESTTYKSSSRHLDRDSVRSGDRDSPRGDLDDVKQKLKNTQSLLEKSRERDDAEEDLKDELRDLKRRIGRVNDDLEYNLRSGRRTAAKDDEKRKLERELLQLEHEDLPALERKMEDHERQKERDKKKFAMERDRRNNDRPDDRYRSSDDRDRSSDDRDRYDDRERERRSSRDRNRDSGRDDSRDRGGYRRGTYDERDDRDARPSSYRSDSNRDYRARTPPPPAPPVAKTTPAPPPPPPPAPAPARTASPAVNTKSMTPEERSAFIKAEAARRVQDRLRALGVASPSDHPSTADTTIADRLEHDRLEAAKRAAQADRELEEKELQRQAKLEREKLRGLEVEQSINSHDEAKVQQVRGEIKNAKEGSEMKAEATKELEAEARAIAEREGALKKEKEERLGRVKMLERELAEAKEAEENFAKNKAKFAAAAKTTSRVPPPPPPSRRAAVPPPAVSRPSYADDDDFSAPPPRASPAAIERAPVASPPVAAAPPPPPPPPAPPASTPPTISAISSPGAKTPSTNPFHRIGASGATPAAVAVKTNPFFPSTVAPVDTAPPKAAYRPPPPPEDDWDSPAGLEKDGSDSSDDEDVVDRNARKNLAQSIFGKMPLAAPSRSGSAQSTREASTSSAPVPPPAPRVFAAAPADSSAPAAPIVPPSALLGQIQGGLRLKKANTVDKSAPAVAGAVIGDPSPPVQTYRPPSPPVTPREAEHRPVSPVPAPALVAPTASNGHHYEEEAPAAVARKEEDPLDAVDLTTKLRTRSIYAYEGQRSEDVSFEENWVILANPAKDPESPWWYGTVEKTGAAGWLPKSYVEEIKVEKATALYTYDGASVEEFSFEENDVLSIVDSSDSTWWKAERNGVIGLVPAAYVERVKESARSTLLPVDTTLPTTFAVEDELTPTVRSSLRQEEEDTDTDDSSDDEEAPDPETLRVRELERIRVLEAAGVLVTHAAPRRRRTAPARPPPAVPTTMEESQVVAGKEDEEEEETEPAVLQEERMEDAYDIYQRVMRDLPPLPAVVNHTPPASPSLSVAPSVSSQATSSFLSVVTGIVRSGSGASTAKPRPVIGAPLISGSNSDRSSVVSIGSSWASLIDKSALESISDRERKRQEAIFELISTERAYVEGLQSIIGVFFSALQPILAEKATSIIFANVEDLMMFNSLFLSDLEEKQKESRLYIDTIGDVIDGRIRGLDCYRVYCINQSNANKTLADLKSSDLSLRATLDTLRVKNLDLESYLLTPFQRLARYPLLIHQIAHYTERDHPDHETLARSERDAESILRAVNESVRAREDEQKLMELSTTLRFPGTNTRIQLTASTRLLGKRTIIKEGPLFKVKSGRKLNAYLFNDILIFTEAKDGFEIVYRWPIPLDECSLRELRDGNSFQLVHRTETFKVRAPTARQAAEWIKEIRQAQKAVLVAVERRRAEMSGRRSGEIV